MQLLSVENLAKSFGVREVLKGVSFGLNEGEKAALVAPNGAGKTTLLRIILGQVEPDAGRVAFLRRGVRPGYLPQSLVAGLGPDVGAVLGRVPGPGGLPPGSGRIQEAVSRFGLGRCGGPSARLESLSGGERTRLALACLWLQEADLLLLDEPTNHLDLAGLAWLAGWIKGFDGTVLVVSHDRYFLDQVADNVIALDEGRARKYPGNYSAYRASRDAEIASLMARYREEERLARRLRAAVIRQSEWFSRAHRDAGKRKEVKGAPVFYRAKAKKAARRGKALERRLERLEEGRVRKPRSTPQLDLSIQAQGRAGRFLLSAEGLSKAYASVLFSGVTFTVGRGEKIGLVGANGSGKTTLLRTLAGEVVPDAGEIARSPSARLAYLDQHASGLRDDWTAVDEVTEMTQDPARSRSLLGSFLFRGDMVYAKVAALSPGERARLALLKLLLSPANLLLLDEPTNHLDLPAREQVEEALAGYEGAVVVVSHDRYLLRRLCTKIWSLEGGGLRVYHGGYEEFAANVDRNALGQVPAGAVPHAAGEVTGPPAGERILLENQVAVLSARLAGMSKDDPDYEETVKDFIGKAGALRLLKPGR